MAIIITVFPDSDIYINVFDEYENYYQIDSDTDGPRVSALKLRLDSDSDLES